jgi:DNA mismatch repair protein MutS2
MTDFQAAIEKLEFERVRTRLSRYAVSEPGRDLLGALPILTDTDAIRARLDEVSGMKQLLEAEGELPLEGIHPVRQAVQKAGVEGSILPSKDLAQIGSTLKAARSVRTYISKRRETVPLLWAIAEGLASEKVLEFNIEQAIDETGAVRAGASRELQSIRRAISDRYDDLRKKLEGILRGVSDLGFSQDEIITTREGRMVIPVKVEHKKHVPGFIHSASASGATVFIEPTETLEFNNEIRSLQFQEQREIDRILRALTVQVGEHKEDLLRSLDLLGRLDALQAKAKYSIEVLGIAPRLTDRGPLQLIQARHPLLLMNHGLTGTVPLDLEIGSAYSTLVISGPNAGGKSVAMKCLGILVLMAQAGLHIPAHADSELRVFRRVFVDIGDEQSIESDLSTFSSHLAHLKEITDHADGWSLVLIDEIGTGTDPGEGGAIAAAVLAVLTERGAVTVATTHHGALKVFAHETPGIENGAMEFNQQSLTPTYRFRAGVPGSSYALEMADRLGFKPVLMERARAFLGGRQTRLEELIQELEASALRHHQELLGVQAERTHLQAMVGEYETRMAALNAETRELKRKAAEEARGIVARANATIERAVREIREGNAAPAAVREVRQQVEQLRTDVLQQEREAASTPPPSGPAVLEPGSVVTIAGQHDAGEIVSISSDGKSATVLFGNVKLRVATPDLRASAKRPSGVRNAPHSIPEREGPAQRELDLRGLTGDEALPMIDKFIDDAILSGLHRIDIIHGKGTGALRKKVTEFLSEHARVKNFRLGEWNEGGTGATVVELGDE